MDEVEAPIFQLRNNSAPSPDDNIFNLMFKKGREALARALHYLFQKSWAKGILPDAKLCCLNQGKQIII